MVVLAVQSPRLIAGLAIAFAHVLAVYGLLQVEPHRTAAFATTPVQLHFLDAEAPSAPARPPPPVKIALPEVLTTQPELPPIHTEAGSSRAITAPLTLPRPLSAEAELALPKLVSVVEYLREPAPRYPPQSRRLREEGVVVLRVLIDERGQACDIAIESSSGYARLDRAAREAVASAVFRPYVEDGAPRRAQVLIPIEFFLNRRSA
jgi:periplasmic protein TonB